MAASLSEHKPTFLPVHSSGSSGPALPTSTSLTGLLPSELHRARLTEYRPDAISARYVRDSYQPGDYKESYSTSGNANIANLTHNSSSAATSVATTTAATSTSYHTSYPSYPSSYTSSYSYSYQPSGSSASSVAHPASPPHETLPSSLPSSHGTGYPISSVSPPGPATPATVAVSPDLAPVPPLSPPLSVPTGSPPRSEPTAMSFADSARVNGLPESSLPTGHYTAPTSKHESAGLPLASGMSENAGIVGYGSTYPSAPFQYSELGPHVPYASPGYQSLPVDDQQSRPRSDTSSSVPFQYGPVSSVPAGMPSDFSLMRYDATGAPILGNANINRPTQSQNRSSGFQQSSGYGHSSPSSTNSFYTSPGSSAHDHSLYGRTAMMPVQPQLGPAGYSDPHLAEISMNVSPPNHGHAMSASSAHVLPHPYASHGAHPQMAPGMVPALPPDPSAGPGVRVLTSRPKPQCWDHGCNGREFSTFSNLLRHQREKSGLAAKSNCPRCGAEFTRTTARNGHMAHDKCRKRNQSGKTPSGHSTASAA